VFTEEKMDEIGARLQLLIENPSDALHRRQGFQNCQHTYQKIH
jgi:hypothetical protein